MGLGELLHSVNIQGAGHAIGSPAAFIHQPHGEEIETWTWNEECCLSACLLVVVISASPLDDLKGRGFDPRWEDSQQENTPSWSWHLMRYTNNKHFAKSASIDLYREKQNQYTHLSLCVLSINLSLDHSTIDLANGEHKGRWYWSDQPGQSF